VCIFARLKARRGGQFQGFREEPAHAEQPGVCAAVSSKVPEPPAEAVHSGSVGRSMASGQDLVVCLARSVVCCVWEGDGGCAPELQSKEQGQKGKGEQALQLQDLKTQDQLQKGLHGTGVWGGATHNRPDRHIPSHPRLSLFAVCCLLFFVFFCACV
jgi:hypothetical protein